MKTTLKRAISADIKTKYGLINAWFGMPATTTKLTSHVDVICIVKKPPKVNYQYGEQRLDLMKIYNRLKKRLGKVKTKVSVVFALADVTPAKGVFVHDSHKIY